MKVVTFFEFVTVSVSLTDQTVIYLYVYLAMYTIYYIKKYL